MQIVIHPKGREPYGETVRMGHTYHSFPAFDPHRGKQKEVDDWYERRCRIEKEPWYQIPSDRLGQLYSNLDQARSALMDYPAPHEAAVLYKLRLALQNEEVWEDDRRALLADAQRLAGANRLLARHHQAGSY